MKLFIILSVLIAVAAASQTYDRRAVKGYNRYDRRDYGYDRRDYGYDRRSYGYDRRDYGYGRRDYGYDRRVYGNNRRYDYGYDSYDRYDRRNYDDDKSYSVEVKKTVSYDDNDKHDYDNDKSYSVEVKKTVSYDNDDHKHHGRSYDNNVYTVYQGKYSGKCGNDGLYYRDEKSFVFCSNGNSYVQPCAPGSRNSGYSKYRYGSKYNYRDFCDVNLVDNGYAAKKRSYSKKH